MILIPALLCLVLSACLPLLVRPLLVRLGIMDVPNERSSHERPILRGLGLAVLIAMTVSGVVAVIALAVTSPDVGRWWVLLLIVVTGTFAAGLLGLAEDLRGLSVGVRSACLLLIALAVPVALLLAMRAFPDPFASGPLDDITVDRGGALPGFTAIPLPFWVTIALVPYAVLFISSYINVANFMDGLNGISGFHGVIAGLTFAAAGFCSGLPWLVLAGLILAAGFAGFLPWNLSKPGAFLGDVGSYLLGGATAITSFAALLAGVPILATIGPMVIYFGDVGVTLVKRVRAGFKWDEPHKEHVYQRVQQLGYSHVAASAMTALCTLAASLLGLASFYVAPIWWIALLCGGLLVLGVYLALPRLLARGRERH